MLAGRAHRPLQKWLQADCALLAGWGMLTHVLLADLVGRVMWHLEDVRHRELLLCQGATAADASDGKQECIDGEQPLADCIAAPAANPLEDLLGGGIALHIELTLLCCEINCTTVFVVKLSRFFLPQIVPMWQRGLIPSKLN